MKDMIPVFFKNWHLIYSWCKLKGKVKTYFLKNLRNKKDKELSFLNIQETIESLILAQDERWRYALHMQVVRKC